MSIEVFSIGKLPKLTERKLFGHGNFIIAVFITMKTGGSRFTNKKLMKRSLY